MSIEGKYDWRITTAAGTKFHFREERNAKALHELVGGKLEYYMAGIGWVPPTKVASMEVEDKDTGYAIESLAVTISQPDENGGKQLLEVMCDYPLPVPGNGSDCYITIRSETGFTLDHTDQLSEILETIVEASSQISDCCADTDIG